ATSGGRVGTFDWAQLTAHKSRDTIASRLTDKVTKPPFTDSVMLALSHGWLLTTETRRTRKIWKRPKFNGYSDRTLRPIRNGHSPAFYTLRVLGASVVESGLFGEEINREQSVH